MTLCLPYSSLKGTPEYRSLCAQYPAVRCDCNHPYLPANPSDSDVETYILQKYYQPRPRRLDGVTSMSYDERAAMVAAMTTTELFQTSDMHKAYILVSEHNSSGYELTIPTLSGTQVKSLACLVQNPQQNITFPPLSGEETAWQSNRCRDYPNEHGGS